MTDLSRALSALAIVLALVSASLGGIRIARAEERQAAALENIAYTLDREQRDER